ncbi:karyopherin/importin beta family nuclear import signal receptor Kap113 [Schizosaccharomyces osmophilus]|uniref:Karyopherin/importin beta family nuclear import signal receptor Kap113 n=1 Tax=Schizosaccharomyces osmophilus TaxID=2545709 RepID=A0AAE9WEV4_9SCHI|nr:karyopherin/importin beta family nuclear import signal receptor Kap113 [Schizosaccharomyces osmophilus]WBW75116.1 karyopherin/importin beta family nuclear import signal receptor Kap113 [Schizosaccharomyces osmophilus]
MEIDPVLYQLKRAASQDPASVKDAETYLQEWKKEPGFFPKLYSIFLDKQNDISLRWLAIIQIRNSIDVIWRKNTKSSLLPGEKEFFRNNALAGSVHSEDQLVVQNALVLSRIARQDYPSEWPSLFQELISSLHQNFDAQQPHLALRLLITLHHIVKAMAGNRLLQARKTFYEITPHLLLTLQPILDWHISQWMHALETPSTHSSEAIYYSMQISRYALKTCRRLVIFGVPNPSDSNLSKEMLSFGAVSQQKVLSLLSNLYISPSSSQIDDRIPEQLVAHAYLFNKLFFDFASYSPCLTVFPSTIDYISVHMSWLLQVDKLFAASSSFPELLKDLEKLVLMSLRVFITVLREIEDTKSSHPEASEIIRQSFLMGDRHFVLLQFIITKLLVLSESDFEDWSEDPEQWVLDQSTHDADYNIRPCSENLLSCLFDHFGELYSHQFESMLESVFQCPSTLEESIQQDALLCSIGTGASHLKDMFPFADWLKKAAIPNLAKITNGGVARVLRRRVSIFLSQWIEHLPSGESLMGLIYHMYALLLNRNDPCNDSVVRLTSIDSLRGVLDDWSFLESEFLNVKNDLFYSVLSSVNEFQTMEGKLSTLSLLGTLISRAGSNIAPLEEMTASLLFQLWNEWASEPMLRTRILGVLAQFVIAIKHKSIQFSQMLAVIIDYCVNAESPDQVMYEADAVELWSSFLQYVEVLPEEFTLLVPHLLHQLSQATSSLPFTLMILNSYLLLKSSVILDNYSLEVLERLTNLLGDVKNDTLLALCKTLSLIFEVNAGDSLQESLGHSTLLPVVLNSILSSEKHAQTLVQYSLLLSRISLSFPNVIISTCLTQRLSVYMLLQYWISLFDYITHAKDRKLTALALTSLLRTNAEEVLEALNPIMHLWFSVLSEVEEDEKGDAPIYYKNEDYSAVGFYLDESSEEMNRRKMILSKDAVHSVQSKTFFVSTFLECQEKNGGAEIFEKEYLTMVDPALLDQMNSML